MNEKPILMSTEMIQAYQAGRKTQTRRICKLENVVSVDDGKALQYDKKGKPYIKLLKDVSPYGMPGDKLWFRETFKTGKAGNNGIEYLYKADKDSQYSPGKWKPSLFMPRAASRYNPTIKAIWIERLLDIREKDALAEGIEKNCLEGFEKEWEEDWGYRDYLVPEGSEGFPCFTAKDSYLSLWDKINGKDSHEKNPLVWVIEFSKLEDV